MILIYKLSSLFITILTTVIVSIAFTKIFHCYYYYHERQVIEHYDF